MASFNEVTMIESKHNLLAAGTHMSHRSYALRKAPSLVRCPVARTLDIIGDRWTILMLRDLLREGPRKFQDFEQSLSGISPNTLSARLRTLEAHGIVERRLYAEHPPRAEYALTEKGRELRFALRALRDWGSKHAF